MAAKKLLTGCLVVVLVLVVGAGAAWWFLLRPMWNAGGEMLSGAKDWASSLDLGSGITNQAPYDPPADGRLTPAQVAALVTVQEVVVREMGSDLRALAERAQQAQAARAADQPPNLQDLASAYRETSALLGRLKAAQAAGVNEAGLSRDEYAFVRRQALAALPLLVDVQGMPGLPGIPGLDAVAPRDDAEREAARHNAELLRPHLPLLRQTLGAGAPAR
ncbi:hypothetical protein [Arenimonas metalli]|uniref:Uncharacterized protein n=1 Tax=Arenimonas metalli CF5-1 TaxID=1384056 RepID=A0A091BAT8_9GAMM|nr:hypothetical protein [Arenimonas metalli]KFN41540.1 hypothetical protein N787_05565 [Arenimonas metalli CF5-1]